MSDYFREAESILANNSFRSLDWSVQTARGDAFQAWPPPQRRRGLSHSWKHRSDKTITWFEVTDVDFKPPPAALFEIPAICSADPQASKSIPRPN
jgi:hypothetical protein